MSIINTAQGCSFCPHSCKDLKNQYSQILCPLLNCDKITNTVVDSNSGRGINMLLVTLKEPCQCSCLSGCVGSLILTCSIFYLLFLQSESSVTPETS